jgi:hypothetical protein
MPAAARRRGFVLITMVVSIGIVLALVGLAIDGGHLQLVKVRMQTAADAAAVAAVNELKAAGAAGVSAAALAGAAANGFTDGRDQVEVAVHSPPSSGYYTGDATAAEVTVRQNVATFFMGLVGFARMDVRARAVARRGPGANCVYALDPAASGALTASGGAVVQVACGVVVDSTSATALSISGNTRLTARSIAVAGGYSATGGAVLSPAPWTHAPPESDPFAHLAAPAAGACDRTGFSVSNGVVATISEGVYCNGITVTGGGTLRLNPGTYVLKGGGLSVSGQSTVTGAGVTFYNTSGDGFGYGAISLSGGATIQLRAPVAGPFAGVLFFQDRSVGSGVGSTITGGTSSYFAGALYFPTTTLSYSGGTAADYTILVAARLTFTRGSVLNNDYSSLADGPPVKASAVLSE